MTRYKFMSRPASPYRVPSGVEVFDVQLTTVAEHGTRHGSALLSRELSADEMRMSRVYPLGYTAEMIEACGAPDDGTGVVPPGPDPHASDG